MAPAVEVMRRSCNPPGTPVDLGELPDAYSDRNRIETEIEPRQAPRGLREADVARLVEDYVAGASIDEQARPRHRGQDKLGLFEVNGASVSLAPGTGGCHSTMMPA